MDYTDEQYDLMEKLANRVLWGQLSDRERELASYLERQGIARARVDIEDGLWALSPDGERVLEAHRKKLLASRYQESIRQENERKENEKQQAADKKEHDRLDREESRRQADRKAEHAFQYKLSLLNAFLAFVSGVASGAVLANLDRIIPWIISLFD